MDKLILDACCGGRMFWFDKADPRVLFMDKRQGEFEFPGNRKLSIVPDVIADFKNMPFDDASFKLVVFDPPHFVQAGDTSYMAIKYGKLPKEWQPEIKAGFDECMRVLEPNGTLVFKWNEDQISLTDILKCIGETPLFGTRAGKRLKTHWLVFMKQGGQVGRE